ncbi:MAG: PRC-barrel domain-containing protein [Alphaproteobacteria bacterium]|nr:PRC-barrel domain-containing protein [Alphaproteobacteria bacterium]
MSIRFPLAVIGVGSLLVASAMAQTTTPPATTQPPVVQAPTTAAPSGFREVKDEKRMVAPWNLSVEKIEKLNVHSAAGDKIGEVDKVLEDSTGQATAVVVEFGGFLGMGETEVVVPVAQLTLQGDRLVTSLSKEQLKAMPRWKS